MTTSIARAASLGFVLALALPSAGCTDPGANAAAERPAADGGAPADGDLAPGPSGADGGSTGDASGGSDGPTPTPRTRARMFLSGHSLTDDPLADFVAGIARNRGDDFAYNQQIVVGSPIRVRTKGGNWQSDAWPGYGSGKNRGGSSDLNVVAELRSPATLGAGEKYDTLVLTERHDILGTIEWEDTVGFTRHFHDRLVEGNAGGRTLLYQSWLDVDKADPQPWIVHEKNALFAWECVASKVNHTLAADGRNDRVATLPVGAALVDLVERMLADQVPGVSGSTRAKLDLVFADNVHTTRLGMYFVALVTYAGVFESSPEGAQVPEGLPVDTATAMQGIAWRFMRDYFAKPGGGTHTMEACRAQIAEQTCASFHTLRREPQNIAGCRSAFGDPTAERNPFRWPDPRLRLWPAPP